MQNYQKKGALQDDLSNLCKYLLKMNYYKISA